MSLVKIDWQPGDAGYRKFGITIFVGFTIIGALLWLLGGSFSAIRDTGEMVWGPLPWFVLIPASVMVVSVRFSAPSRAANFANGFFTTRQSPTPCMWEKATIECEKISLPCSPSTSRPER